MLDRPPTDDAGRQFYKNDDHVIRRIAEVKAQGFQWGSLNAMAMFQAGYRSIDALIDKLAGMHERIRKEFGG